MAGAQNEQARGRPKLRKNGDRNGEETCQGGAELAGGGEVGREGEAFIRHTPVVRNCEEITEKVADYIPTPPNGGWGWVIVCASLVGNLIVDGISYSFGVFLLEFVEAYKETKSKVSLVGSLLSGVYLFVGPIVSAMTNKFGCRPIVIAGSIMATAGFVLSTLSPGIEVLMVTYGVIGGFGLGMIYLPCIVSVGYYFDTKRAFATGLAVCGSGLGTFIFPPLSEFLLSEYNWQGGLLIIAAIILQGCVCGSLMRPLEAESPTPKRQNVQNAEHIRSELEEYTPTRTRSVSESGHTPVSAESRTRTHVRVAAGNVRKEEGNWNTQAITKGNRNAGKQENSVPEVCANFSEGDTSHSLSGQPLLVQTATADGGHNQVPMKPDLKQSNGASQSLISEILPLLEVTPSGVHNQGVSTASLKSFHVSKEDLARPLYRKDIFYSGSVANLPQFHSQPDMRSYLTSVTTIPGESRTPDGASARCVGRLFNCLPQPAQDVMVEMLDVSLFKDISFMFVCLGNFAAFLGMYVPFMFIVDRTASQGVDRSQAAFLISVIGISNTAGRIVIGKVADLHIVDSFVITYVSVAVMGLATGLVPFCNTYPLLATNMAVFGLGMAAFIALSSIVICDRMGVEKLTNAFGLLTLVRGTAAILGPPLAGFLFDTSGSYDMSFFIGGLMLLAGSGCLILLHLPVFQPKEPNQKDFELTIATDERSRHELITTEHIHSLVSDK